MEVKIKIDAEVHELLSLSAEGVLYLSKWKQQVQNKANATLKLMIQHYERHGVWVTPVPFGQTKKDKVNGKSTLR